MVHGLSATSTEYVLDKSLVQNLKMGTFDLLIFSPNFAVLKFPLLCVAGYT